MTVDEQDIINALKNIKSVHNVDDLKKLEILTQQLGEFGVSESGIQAFLGIFERFPMDDGFGIFWSILHGLEKLPGYETHLIQSLQRQPAKFSLLMVQRILNSGCSHIDDTDLLILLKNIAEDHTQAQEIKEHAQRIIERE